VTSNPRRISNSNAFKKRTTSIAPLSLIQEIDQVFHPWKTILERDTMPPIGKAAPHASPSPRLLSKEPPSINVGPRCQTPCLQPPLLSLSCRHRSPYRGALIRLGTFPQETTNWTELNYQSIRFLVAGLVPVFGKIGARLRLWFSTQTKLSNWSLHEANLILWSTLKSIEGSSPPGHHGPTPQPQPWALKSLTPRPWLLTRSVTPHLRTGAPPWKPNPSCASAVAAQARAGVAAWPVGVTRERLWAWRGGTATTWL
jgi:hypothetical protein